MARLALFTRRTFLTGARTLACTKIKNAHETLAMLVVLCLLFGLGVMGWEDPTE